MFSLSVKILIRSERDEMDWLSDMGENQKKTIKSHS